ncbi:hypothetical protein A3C57_02710 [Candidatus Nomurabacteria bacterium RIFCSPHIGHO2_02_FULL_33_12]|uniref:Peptidase A2 domain-containing protein n=1 Tax=Candidatus Nomurabacteria bacterium RIFCSPLOWO2_01_FULL_33_17 TaxID=1801764 RepID=A0A1F6WNU8_9BACT|nr:MAG: hypothetical protein A3C57_02710 [Candidatus Nomurabacteria bacterium RIFCSPHIGHO2_02_FULL_33_12]OGI83571.1 MAG: hypothetical protein A2903_02530 [Candidatus Nomurabacteria bacterium RIFCSPLOWO2_01_FULL_33_17]
MKFKYKRYNNKTLRPVIPIKLKNDNQEIGYEVLVDSGADMCLFDAEIGEAIGIDIKKGLMREVFGVGGKASFYYLHKIKIEVSGWEYQIEAGFMPNVSGRIMQYGLVGQNGFFDNFIIKFDLLKEEIDLKNRF